MKSLKSLKPPKDQREQSVLMGLVGLYIETGRAVSSNQLRDHGFSSLSSATIRNYFAKLEEGGYLLQQHSSGGRIPTVLAYQLYANLSSLKPQIEEEDYSNLKEALTYEGKEIATYLQRAATLLSQVTHCAIFLSAPRFDQDFILDVKCVAIDARRFLCVLITDFGLVQPELLYTAEKLSSPFLKKLEAYFRWKLTGHGKPTLPEREEELVQRLYSEVMLRHLVGHNNLSVEDITKTGFSELLHYADFNDATALASGLALFENRDKLRSLLSECAKGGALKHWIGGDLGGCSVAAIPYRINQTIVGSVALLGPHRIPYPRLFALLEAVSEIISASLTRSLYKFKITFRTPEMRQLDLPNPLLLENKR